MAFIGTSVVPTVQSVTKRIYNVTIAAPNVEQSQPLPSTIVGYMIRTRNNSDLKLSHTSSQSGSLYLTIPGNATYEDAHTYNNLTLYFQSPDSGDTVEIVAWEV